MAEAPQQRDDRPPHLREEHVVVAGDEQRDPHRPQGSGPARWRAPVRGRRGVTRGGRRAPPSLDSRRRTRHACTMTETSSTQPYLADLEAERRGWYALVDLVRSLEPDEHLVFGYYEDPPWSVRDVVGHIGTWLAEAAYQFERIRAGTYEGHDDRYRWAQRHLPRRAARPAMGGGLGPGERRPHPDATGVDRTTRTLGRGRLVDPQIRRRALRGTPSSPGGMGRRAQVATRRRGGWKQVVISGSVIERRW